MVQLTLLVVLFVPPTSASETAPDPSVGAQLFRDNGVLCHSKLGMGEGYLAMAIPDYPTTNLVNTSNTGDRDRILEVFRYGGSLTGISTYMPPWGDELRPSEIRSVIRFIRRIRKQDSGTAVAGSPMDSADYREWRLPTQADEPEYNRSTAERVALGKQLFFDPMMSKDRDISCASCHDPAKGWSDGLAVGVGHRGALLTRASPSIINSAFNKIQMWDGRFRTLEDQVRGPIESPTEMNLDPAILEERLNERPEYIAAFAQSYPGEPMNIGTIAKAIAAFERTVIHRNSPFDQWLDGDTAAMSEAQLRGMDVFMDEDKGHCAVCHSAPNFTDNGFHNVGLDQQTTDEDVGRYKIKPIKEVWGAFKTPIIRDVALTAPYFHDGSAATLSDVIAHYRKGSSPVEQVSLNMKAITISDQEASDLEQFLHALTSEEAPFEAPVYQTFAGSAVD